LALALGIVLLGTVLALNAVIALVRRWRIGKDDRLLALAGAPG
jgi:tungstate transport system permease protein